MTDLRRGAGRGANGGQAGQVLRGTVLLAISRILDRVSTFVIALLIASRLGASGLGSYVTAMAIYQAFSLAGQAGATSFLMREISRDRSLTAEYVVHASALALLLTLSMIGALELIVPHLGYSRTTEAATAIIVLAVAGTVLNSIQEATFVAHGRTEFEAMSTLLSSVAYIAIGATLIANGHGIASLMWTYLALEYAVTIGYFVLISRFIARLRVRFRIRRVIRIAREMRAFIASSALAAVFARPEVVILSLLASSTQVGYYGAALRIADLPTFLPEVFMANVFTLLSSTFGHDEQRFRSIQLKATRSMLAFSLPLAALIFAAAPGIVSEVFGARFHPAVTLLRILSFNIVFVSLLTVFWRSLAARRRQDVVLRVQVALVGLRLGGGAALIAPAAGLGAAIATSANSAVWAILLIAAAARAGAPAPVIQTGWRFAVAAGISGGATWLIARATPTWLALAAGLIIYLPCVWACGAVSADDRELLRRLRPRPLEHVE